MSSLFGSLKMRNSNSRGSLSIADDSMIENSWTGSILASYNKAWMSSRTIYESVDEKLTIGRFLVWLISNCLFTENCIKIAKSVVIQKVLLFHLASVCTLEYFLSLDNPLDNIIVRIKECFATDRKSLSIIIITSRTEVANAQEMIPFTSWRTEPTILC